MFEVKEVFVAEPPTSQEVRKRTLDALQNGNVLRLILGAEIQKTSEDTSNDLTAVEFGIHKITQPGDGSMRIAGLTTDGNSVTINTYCDFKQPATARLLFEVTSSEE